MTGPVPSGIDEIGLDPGSHVCAFYRGDADRDRLLSGYLGAGLTAGDKCVCVVDSADTAQQLGMLPGACAEPGPYTGQLDIHLPESTYLAGGEFTTGDMLTFWTENMAKAEIEGYSFCRLVGEMTWALRDAPGVEHLVGYESELNRVTASYPVIVLCLYDLDRFSGEVVVNIVKTHPQVLIQGILVENPYYVGPDEFLGLGQPRSAGAGPRAPDRPPMTAEQRIRNSAPHDSAAVVRLPRRPGRPADADLRERLGEFRALLVISLLMTESVNEEQILELAASSAPGLGPWRVEGYGFTDGQWRPGPDQPTAAPGGLTRQLAGLGSAGGPVDLPGRPWAQAYPLRGVSGLLGHLVASCEEEPSAEQRFLIQVIAQQTGVAVSNARLHARERATAAELAATNDGARRDRHQPAAQHGHPPAAHPGGGLRRGPAGHRQGPARADRDAGRDRGPVRQPDRLGRPWPPGPVPEGVFRQARAPAAPADARRLSRSRTGSGSSCWPRRVPK